MVPLTDSDSGENDPRMAHMIAILSCSRQKAALRKLWGLNNLL